jgi:Raf kinase inhibitor-like YbhB/YbcL family protein
MKVSVALDGQGYLPDAYGKFSAAQDQGAGMCLRSFPFSVTDVPQGTQALAWIFMDWDSTPVCGFPWMHWCAYQADVTGDVEFADDVSRKGRPGLVQGYNSAAKRDPQFGVGYEGPCPPDADHVYTMHVVALDAVPQLEAPFWANQLVAACRGHVLAEASVLLPSRS